MNRKTVDNIHLHAEEIMKSLNIKNYTVKLCGTISKNEGYMSDIVYFQIVTSAINKQTYNLVIKRPKQSDIFRNTTPANSAYHQEFIFYSKILPAFNKFQMEKMVRKPFLNIPKCYSVSFDKGKEGIILENVKSLGYTLYDARSMNLKHVLLTLRQYGKFHALSLALKHEEPLIFENITKDLKDDIYGDFIVHCKAIGIFHNAFNNLKNILQENQEIQALQKFDGFETEFEKILKDFSKDCTPSAILHGDCWNNNLLFKYNDNHRTNPVDMHFIDFQITRVGSPVIDLSYFLYSSADKDILDDFDFDHLLHVYYSSASEYLNEFGISIETVLPFEKLKDQWKEYGKYGLVLCLVTIKLSLCDADEAPDIQKTAEGTQDYVKLYDFKIRKEEIYIERVKNVYLHFAKNFL